MLPSLDACQFCYDMILTFWQVLSLWHSWSLKHNGELGRNTLVITSRERSSLFIRRSAIVRLTNSLAPLSSLLIKIISKHVVTRFLTRRQLSLLTVSIPYTAQTCEKSLQICTGKPIYAYSCDKSWWDALPNCIATSIYTLAALFQWCPAPLKNFDSSFSQACWVMRDDRRNEPCNKSRAERSFILQRCR